MPTLFVDTCVFLHYKTFLQLPWRTIAKAETVSIIVCLPVINELDDKTHDPRLAERATRSLKDIIANRDKEFQDGVTLTVQNLALRKEDFPPSMSFDHKDDLVILCALRYAEHNPAAKPVQIATADYGMLIRSPHFGIDVVTIPDNEKLPDVQDEMLKKLRKAEAELAAERNRRPKLVLQITPVNGKLEEADTSIILSAELPQVRDVDSLLSALAEKYPLIGSRQVAEASRPEINPMFYDERAIEWYNDDVDKFLRQSEVFYTKMNKWVQAHGSFFEFDLFIDNIGTAPASQIRLEITFPRFVRLLPDSAIPPLPTPSRLPKRGHLGVAAGKFDAFEQIVLPIHQQISAAIEKAALPTFEISHNESKIRSTIPQLPHKNPQRLRTFLFWFPKDEVPRTFGASYYVRAAELPQDIEGNLTFRIQSPAGR